MVSDFENDAAKRLAEKYASNDAHDSAASVNAEEGASHRSRRGSRAALAAFSLLAALSLGGFVWAHASVDGRLQDQAIAIAQLRSSVSQSKAALSNTQTSNQAKANGVDADRVSHDNELATQFASLAYNWDSHDSYESARKQLQDKYGLPADGQFLSQVMPQDVEQKDNDGNTFTEIDSNKLNMKFESLTSHVTGIDGSTYRYMAEVSVRSSNAGGYSATGGVLLSYSITGDGTIKDVSAVSINP